MVDPALHPSAATTPARPPGRVVRARAAVAVLVALGCAAALGARLYAGGLAHYERVERPALLREAGPIETGPLRLTVSPDVALPAANRPVNAAPFYAAALNSYNARRLPYLKNRKLNPFANEPALTHDELAEMLSAATCRDCDFYAPGRNGSPLAFVRQPGSKPWPFQYATDPYAQRPYVGIVRLVAQGALDAGKKRERGGLYPEAEPLYDAVARFGWHLTQHPGSILDVQLGIELQQKGLHYLDRFYALTHKPLKQRACWRYGDALKELQARISHKYAQLGNVEAARTILRSDSEVAWRIEAATALRDALAHERLSWFARRSIVDTLTAERQDADPRVRAVVWDLTTRPDTTSAPTPAEMESEP